jgi:hypothetical protein
LLALLLQEAGLNDFASKQLSHSGWMSFSALPSCT